MKKTEDLFEEARKDDEELLDFEFDDLSEEDFEAASGESLSDEEIIELDDIIETGEFVEETESEGITKVLEGEKPLPKPEGAEAGADLTADELDKSLEGDLFQDLDTELDTRREALDSAELESSDTGQMSRGAEVDEITRLLDEEETADMLASGDEKSSPTPSESEELWETQVSEDLAADLDAEFEDLETSEVDILDSAEKMEEDDAEETIRVLTEDEIPEEDSGGEEKSELASSELDEPLETEASKDLAAELEAEFEGLETSEINIVETNKTVNGSEAEEIERLLGEADITEKQVSAEEGGDLKLDEVEQPEGGDSSQVVEMQLDAALESLEASEKTEPEFELLDSDLEGAPDVPSMEETEFDIKGLEDAKYPDLEVQESEEGIAPKLPHEDFSEELESRGEEAGEQGPVVVAGTEGSMGISEERIEEIITRVVQDVVERVARETMANVAEKLITEAIDELKASLEAASD